MPDQVPVELDRDVLKRLQGRAVPLEDTVSTVITRVLDELERLESASRSGTAKGGAFDSSDCQPMKSKITPGSFETNRKVKIPLGILRASYRPRGKERVTFEAEVTPRGIEFANKVFDDPSPAGFFAKELAGATDQARNTNGWEFWEYLDEETDTWLPLKTLREQQR